MVKIRAPHEVLSIGGAHYFEVREEMIERGSKVEIRAFRRGSLWIALEGSHRLQAAFDLGAEVTLLELLEEDEMDHDFGLSIPIRPERDPVWWILEQVDRLDGPVFLFPEERVRIRERSPGRDQEAARESSG